MKNVSLWTGVWFTLIIILVLFPIGWYINERFIKGSTLLYETGITFMFFYGLAFIAFMIWLIGKLIKSKFKKSYNTTDIT